MYIRVKDITFILEHITMVKLHVDEKKNTSYLEIILKGGRQEFVTLPSKSIAESVYKTLTNKMISHERWVFTFGKNLGYRCQ